MVLGALRCLNSADFEKKKIVNFNIVLEVFIMSEIMTHTSNLKNTILVRAHRPSK